MNAAIDSYVRFFFFVVGVFSIIFILSKVPHPKHRSNVYGTNDTSHGLTTVYQNVSLSQRPKVIFSSPYDKSCTKKGVCFHVASMFYHSMIYRCIYMDGFEYKCDTIKKLIVPKKFANMSGVELMSQNTSKWEIEAATILPGYVAEFIAAPIAFKALSFNASYDDGKKVLIIGLGGGSVDMYLAQYRKLLDITVIELEKSVIKLAEKWFGVHNTQNRRTLNTNGVEYIKHSKTDGTKFDAIFIDACDVDKELPCPGLEFRTAETVSLLKQIVTPNGAIMFNMWEKTPKAIEFAKLLMKHFPTCVNLPTNIANTIITCVTYPLEGSEGEWKLQKINERFNIAVEQLLNIH